MKKLSSIFLSAMLLFSLAACANEATSTPTSASTPASTGNDAEPIDTDDNGGAATASSIDFDEEPYNVVVVYPVMSEAQPDLSMIQAAINEIMLPAINATVEFEAVGLFSMANVYALKASSQEKMDLMCLMPGYSYLTAFANSNMLMPIEEYVDEWGHSIKEVLGDAYNAGSFNGHQYGIPQNDGVDKMSYGFNVSETMCIEYGIDYTTIKTLEDLEAVFELISESAEGVTVVTPEQSGGNIAMVLMEQYDALGTQVARLVEEPDGSLKVVANVEQQDYMDAAIKVREWYEKGYISRDVTTTQESGSQMLWAGKAFATTSPSISPSMGGITNGMQFRALRFDVNQKILRNTTDDQLALWAVPTYAQRPDKSIQVLNFFMENAEATNLFKFGIEGEHYEFVEEGVVDRTNLTGWQNNWYSLGNYFDCYIMKDSMAAAGSASVEEHEARQVEWNKTQITLSPAYGFQFDPSPVRNEIATCDAVVDEYAAAIGNGTVDPTVEIPKYIDKLYDAGLQTILDEAQSQLDAWLAAK